jgi:hypothetical protein
MFARHATGCRHLIRLLGDIPLSLNALIRSLVAGRE